MKPRVLVIFATSYGQTEKIARRIAATLERNEITVELCDAGKTRPAMATEQYSAILVGSSIIAKGHQPAIRQFIHENASTLNRLPSAFFQVSASAGSGSPHARMAAQRIMEEFLAGEAWTPLLSASVAGAINYTRYNLLLRWYMKKASEKNGGSTDTSRDHEYTDWVQVERFASAFAMLVKPVRRAKPEPALSA